MALIEGKTGMPIADVTVFSDGRLKWGFCKEGPDHCGVTVVKSATKHHNVRSSQYRISFLFATNKPPAWWGRVHVIALKEAMGKMQWELERAAVQSTRGNVIDVSEDRSKGSVPDIVSK